MSFSSSVKNELCRIDAAGSCCLNSELAAVIRTSAVIKPVKACGNHIKIVTENAAFARRVYSAIKKLCNINPEIIIRKSRKLKKHVSYILVITDSMGSRKLLDAAGISCADYYDPGTAVLDSRRFVKKACCRKAYLRGAFLSGGSVSDPEKTYHLEITNHNMKLAQELNAMMNSFGLKPKIVRRKGSFVSYLKEGENIVDFLNVIGAHNALLQLENVRILKEMRNSVNRIVNCETANLEKTVNASVRQVENIKYINESIGFENLPDNLRQVAELRLQYTDVSLKELGEMLDPPLGKSGVNHRLRKLDQLAENHRELRGDA